MTEIISTRLRYVASRDPNKLLIFSNSLPYKIEIKGGPFFNGKIGKWYLWFIVPDNVGDSVEIASGELD